MMRGFYCVAFILFSSLSSVCGADEDIKPYRKGDWSSITKLANSKPMAIHFWGVTCPTCVKDLPKWGRFVSANARAQVVFIEVDEVPLPAIQKMLKTANLQKANNYYLSDSFDDRVRYEIDPKWHGETPTTFVIDKRGHLTRLTGSINLDELGQKLK